MASSKTSSAWTDYAVLTSSTGTHSWIVQRHEDGRFRCSCPSYIFCNVTPRTCKHVRKCEEQVMQVPVVMDAEERWRQQVRETLFRVVRGRTILLTPKVFEALVEGLAQEGANLWGGPRTRASAPVVGGVRKITFDD